MAARLVARRTGVRSQSLIWTPGIGVANESVYVLSGEWEESGATYTKGAFLFAPKGQPHGPHVARTEVVSLTIFDGPLTVVPA